MAVLNQIPIDNVSMADLRDTLNAHGSDVTNVLGTFFENYNGNSKLKPVSNPAQMTLFNVYKDSNGRIQCDTDPTTSSGLIWGMKPCLDTQDGYFYRMASAFVDNIGTAESKYGDWNVVKPTGGSSSPYRLADFRGYNPSAKFPFFQGVTGYEGLKGYNMTENSTITVNTALKSELNFFVSGQPKSDFSSIKDFLSKYKDHRFIVELYNVKGLTDTSWKTSLPTKVWTSSNTIGTMDYWSESIKLDVVNDMGLSNGKFAVVLFGLGGNITAGGSAQRYHTNGIFGKIDKLIYPFLRWIKVVTVASRKITLVRYRFGVSNWASSWYDNNNLPPLTYIGFPIIHVEMKVEKNNTTQRIPSSSQPILNLRLLAYGQFSDGTSQKVDNGRPADSNGSALSAGYVDITTGNAGTYQTIYWIFENLVNVEGNVGGFVLQTSGDNGATWINTDNFELYTSFS